MQSSVFSGDVAIAKPDPLLGRTARRLVTVPAYTAVCVFLLAASPLALPLLAVTDLFRRRGVVLIRCYAILVVFFCAEVVGVAASFWIWLRSAGWRSRPSEDYLRRNFALQCRWASALFWSGARIFSLRVHVEGDSEATRGPVIVMTRHVSPVDNLIPAVFLSARHGLRLRWVVNRWLLRDPCIDIVGNRLPNAFVSNQTDESDRYRARVSALAQGLDSASGVLIYPEGGLASRTKLTRVQARMQEGPYGERVNALRNVLPPRLGGSMALLRAAPAADVVFCAHTGLEPAGSYRSFLSGGLNGATIRIQYWRIPATEIPAAEPDRINWLFARWAEVDEWVERHRADHEPKRGAS